MRTSDKLDLGMTYIEQIKAEIEKLKAKYRKDMYKSNYEGLASGYKIEAYNELLSFLSTLESEKPISQNEDFEKEIADYWTTMGWSKVMTLAKFKVIARYFYGLGLGVNDKSKKPINPEEAMKVLEEKIALVKQRGTWDGVNVDKFMDEVRGREPEKPMQEELDEEIESYWKENGPMSHAEYDRLAKCARYFAQWQKEQDEISKVNYEGARAVYDNTVQHLQEKIDEKYELGKKDMKEQMLKEAVSGWLDEDNEPPYDLNVVCEEKIPFGKFKHGDKVKLVIVKE